MSRDKDRPKGLKSTASLKKVKTVCAECQKGNHWNCGGFAVIDGNAQVKCLCRWTFNHEMD